MGGRAGEFAARMYDRSGTDRLPAHLEDRYGIAVTRLTELDLGVFRVDRCDGPSRVARVFPRRGRSQTSRLTPKSCFPFVSSIFLPNGAGLIIR